MKDWPDPAFDLGSARSGSGDAFISDHDQGEFTAVQSLADDPARARFLVWDELAFGEPITDAYFEVDTQASDNRLSAKPDRELTFHDASSGRWFVPLAKLAQGQPLTALNPVETRWIRLELHLRDGRIAYVRLGLRLAGPVPALEVQEGLRMFWPDVNSFLAGEARTGIVFQLESFRNPSKRRLRLVFHAQGQLELRQLLEHRSFGTNYSAHWTGPSLDRLVTVAPFLPDAVRLHKAGGQSEIDSLRLGSPDPSIELAPGESVDVAWIARRANLTDCAPTVLPHLYTWTVTDQRCVEIRDSRICVPVPVQVSETKTEATYATEVALVGAWSRKVEVTDALLAASDPGAPLVIERDFEENATLGAIPISDGLPAYSCSGLMTPFHG